MKLLIVGGTQESRELIGRLSGIGGLEIHVTVVTEYGGNCLAAYPNIQVHQGRLDQQGMAALIRRIKADLLVDASHPFAVAVSVNAHQAAAAVGIPYLRVERPPTSEVGAGVTRVADFAAAARQVAACNGNILLTTGSNNLAVFTRTVADFRRRLFVRVLPTGAVLQKCEDLGLTARNIMALQGPFTAAMNREMIRYCQADVVVTKDSGETGGSNTKLTAARQLKVPVVMVARPGPNCRPAVGSVAAAVEWVIGMRRELSNNNY
jgi:precorrin-6A/cobalt-precorrin-6A reductase